MFKATQNLLGLVVGLFFVVGSLLCGATARAQTAPTQDTLWWWDPANGTLAVCLEPANPSTLGNCFNGLVPQATGSQLITTDGVYVYTATYDSGWGYKCPIAGPGTNNGNCQQILIGPWNGNNPNGYTAVSITAVAAGNGKIFTALYDGSIWQCPDDLDWKGFYYQSDYGLVGCVQFDTAGTASGRNTYNYATSLVLVGDTLYAGLSSTDADITNGTGILWSCSATTANSCTVLDNAGKNDILSLTAGAGYIWAGLSSGLVWKCDLINFNWCASWDKAGQEIAGLSYDGNGTLGIITGGYNQSGVVWSCPTSYSNACATLLSMAKDVYPTGVAAGEGNVWSTFQGYVTLNSAYSSIYGNEGANLLFIPAGGLTTNGTAKIQVPFAGDAHRLAKLCGKKRHRATANVTVSGPYGMKVKRRVNLCKFYDADEVRSEIEFGALDYGQYRVTVQSRSFYGQADFVLNDNNVQNVSVTLRKRRN